MLGTLSWGYFVHIPEPEQAGTGIGYSRIPSRLLRSSLPTHSGGNCSKRADLWNKPIGDILLLPCLLWFPDGFGSLQSFWSLTKGPYPTKPAYQPSLLTWHAVTADTLWWAFYSQTRLQLYVNARLQTSVHGILIFVLVVNLHWQYCSAGSDHPLYLIFIQSELEALSRQSDCTPERRTVSVTAACNGRQESEWWILNMRHRILEFNLTFLHEIYGFTCFLAGWW